MQATNARDFDRRVREEFEMSEEELDALKNRLLTSGKVKRPSMPATRAAWRLIKGEKPFLNDAQKIDAGERVDERLKWCVPPLFCFVLFFPPEYVRVWTQLTVPASITYTIVLF